MTQEKVYIGIDVSKESLDVAIHEENMGWSVANDSDGIQALVKQLKPLSPALIVLESTGGLEINAATALYLENLPVAHCQSSTYPRVCQGFGNIGKNRRN